MAQRVGDSRKPLDGLLKGLGRAAAPILRAMSRRAILPLPPSLPLPGLQREVESHFDEYGIPHVRAASDSDAFRVQGYLHARDRFFQMDVLRRVLRGGLAGVVGERPLGRVGFLGRKTMPTFGRVATTVDSDRLLRVFDLERAAEGVWAAAAPSGRALLQAYVDGVNAAIERMRRRRPVEHRLLGLALEPWRPIDSIIIGKGMALGLAFKWRAAPVFMAMAEELRDESRLLDDVLPPVPGQTSLPHTRCLVEGLEDVLQFLPPAASMGSNAWMVAGGRSQSGKPIVASDPHLDFGLPSIWYLASLQGDRYKAVGCTLPGLPGVVIGRTPSTAWALTNGMLDDCDLWVEELDEAGANYRVDDAWLPLESETQSLERKGADPVLVRVRRTHRGPVFSDAFPDYKGPAISMRMALQEPTQDLEAFLGLGRARTVPESLEAVRPYGTPAQNLMIADTHGEAAYRLIGKVPTRAVDAHPALARDGTTRASDWTGWVDWNELPSRHLGANDEIVSANQPPVDDAYPHYLSHLYEPDYRAESIESLLRGQDSLSVADMLRMHADTRNAALGRFRRAVLEPHLDAVRRMRPTLGPMADALLAWDGAESADDRGGVPWHLVYHHLVRRTFTPRLGADLVRHWMGVLNLIDFALYAVFESDDSPWAPVGERPRLLAEAMDAAAHDLQRLGLQLDATWGAFHTLTFHHPLGASTATAHAFQQGPFPADGGPWSLVSGQYAHARPGPVVAGQSYRQAIDLANPEGGRMITFGGQSGHIGSPHYADLTPLWRAYQTVPMRLETLPPNATVTRFVPS